MRTDDLISILENLDKANGRISAVAEIAYGTPLVAARQNIVNATNKLRYELQKRLKK